MQQRAFKPKPGQTDYSKARWAPVINCAIKCGSKILLVLRGNVGYYSGYWSGVSGFIDDDKSFDEKVRDEIKEEVGISEKDIRTIRRGEIFHQEDPKYEKTWIVHPVLVEVHRSSVRLNSENKDFAWVDIPSLKKYKLMPGFDLVLEKLSLI